MLEADVQIRNTMSETCIHSDCGAGQQVHSDAYLALEAAGVGDDWIIFAKHDGQNYYLDLATHEEAQGQANSERLMQKLRVGGRAEFPFLF